MMLRARRLVLAFTTLLFLGLVALAGRLGWLAVGTHAEAVVRMDKQSLRVATIPARRGDLNDRHGRLLASSAETMQAAVLPRNVHRRADNPEDVAGLVEQVADFLEPRVEAHREELARRLGGTKWTVLGRPVEDPDAIDDMERHRRDILYGVDLEHGWQRRYPWGRIAGNLVGYVSHEAVGVSGLEAGLDHLLRGHEGARRYRVDHLGREVTQSGHAYLPPVDGLGVTLSLDIRMQQVVEQEALQTAEQLEATRVSVVALDPKTGEILAMVSVPGLDLSDGSDRPQDGSICGAVQEVYPPGSTFKPLMMAAALELGLAHPGDAPIDCRAFDGGRRRIRDTHPQSHPLTLEEVIVHSSNIGMAKILTRLVPREDPRNVALMRPLHALLGRLGLGRRTGVPIPAEVPGIVTPIERWSRNYTLASVAFGQELGVSVLQMAAAASTLCDGVYRRPRLVLECTSADGQQTEPKIDRPHRVFAPDVVETVRGYMARSVQEGSCREVSGLGLPVAGKTGTAQCETRLDAEIHSYVALVPAEDPVLTLVVAVREPQGVRYASQSAAPTAGRILRRLLPYLGLSIEE